MQWIQDPSQNNVDFLNNVRREVIRHIRNKNKAYLRPVYISDNFSLNFSHNEESFKENLYGKAKHIFMFNKLFFR